MNQENINQQQQQNVIGGNVQEGVPQAQDDPALIINQHYLPRGDLTISSNISFVDSSVTPITIPLVQIPTLFRQTFDSTEMNLADDEDIEYYTNKYSPAPQVTMPNISIYLGYVILGVEMDIKYLESIMICCQNYLNGTMEILPSGTFRYLNQRRDGLSRRYTKLCMAVYYSISSNYYKVRPRMAEMVREMQALMQDLYDDNTYTSVLTELTPYRVNDHDYTISKSTIRRWATTITWHALMYNSQSPLTFQQFLDLFFKIYSIAQGKILRYDLTHINDQQVLTIIPNSHLFVHLTPENMISSEVQVTSEIPQRFISLMRYLPLANDDMLEWSEDDDDDDERDNSEQEDNQNAESVDESALA
uniref:Uncharacterized protein n=1 Tax=Ceratitis capitata TaxID=7213 RepID=W8CBU9_CERCA